MTANFIESSPIPVKAALAMMGMIGERYRLPLVPMGRDNRKKFTAVLKEAGLV
jgi:4-hydroxy-tetrahydrodipicolinate synthase